MQSWESGSKFESSSNRVERELLERKGEGNLFTNLASSIFPSELRMGFMRFNQDLDGLDLSRAEQSHIFLEHEEK